MGLRGTRIQPYYGPSKGLITNVPASELDAFALTASKNILYLPGGGYKTRYGTTKLNSSQLTETATAKPFTGLFHWQISSGTNYLIATNGTKVYKMESADGTWDDITGAVTVTDGQNNISSWTVMNDLVIIGQNETNIIKWSGTGNAAVLGGSPTIVAEIVFAYRDYLFVTGLSTNPSRFISSNASNPESYTDGVDIKVPFDDDGQMITGLAQVGPNQVLLIFKNKSIYRLIGTSKSNFRVEIVDNRIGSVNHASIVSLGNRIYFFNGHDFFWTDGFQTQNISRLRIGDTLDGFNQARTQYVTAKLFEKEHIILWNITDSGDTGHSIVMTYDYLLDAWGTWEFNGPTHNVMEVYYPFNAAPILYIGGTNGYAYKYDSSVNTDIGDASGTNAINYNMKLGPVSGRLNTNWFRRTFLTPKVEGAYNMNITSDIDFGQGGGQTETINLSSGRKTLSTWVMGQDPLGAPSKQKSTIMWPTNHIGGFFQMEITAPSKDSRFEFGGFDQEIVEIGAR